MSDDMSALLEAFRYPNAELVSVREDSSERYVNRNFVLRARDSFFEGVSFYKKGFKGLVPEFEIGCSYSDDAAAFTAEDEEGNVLLIKYTPEGEPIWIRIYDLGGEFWENLNSLDCDQEGYIVGAGIIGPDYFHSDFLTVKFSPNGDTIWCRRVDRYSVDATTGVICDAANNIYVSGWSDADGVHHPVLIKYLPSGETLWTRENESTKDAHIYDIGLDSTGNVLLIGDIDDPPVGMTTSCLFMKYTPFGELGWTRTYRLDAYNHGFKLCLSGPDVVYLMGTTIDSMSENPDMFVMKLRYSAGIEMPSEWGACDATFRLMNPNPVRAGEPVCLFVQRAGDYRLMVCDVSGREVVKVYSGYLNAGVNSVAFAPLSAGVYVLILESGNYKAQARLVIVR